jgi:hypothetical protein
LLQQQQSLTIKYQSVIASLLRGHPHLPAMYGSPCEQAGAAVRAFLCEKNMAIVAGTGAGKSNDISNMVIRDELGVRAKFLQILLLASTATLDFLNCETLEEYLTAIRNLPAHLRFNPYWIILLDIRFGRQSTRDRVEVFTDAGLFMNRVDGLCAKDRDAKPGDEPNFVRPPDEERTLCIMDEQDFSGTSWLSGIIKDANHVTRENAIFVRCCKFIFNHL